MDALHISLLVTGTAMAGVLTLAFFDIRIKLLLAGRLYQRVFAFFTITAMAGILFTSSIGFANQQNDKAQSVMSSISVPR